MVEMWEEKKEVKFLKQEELGCLVQQRFHGCFCPLICHPFDFFFRREYKGFD